MTNYTHIYEDLKLRVTLATWRKAQLPGWSDAEWRIHLHSECVLYLNSNGKHRVFGATIEDIDPQNDRGLTDWDQGRGGCPRAGDLGTGSKEPLPVASAAPADTEWPKFVSSSDESVAVCMSEDCCVWHGTSSDTWSCRPYSTLLEATGCRPIARADALAFLRANGHAKVADKLERQAKPAPADTEWPKFMWDDAERHGLLVFTAENTSTYYARGGRLGITTERGPNWSRYAKDYPQDIVHSHEALKWLRANGHAKVAEELERHAAPAAPVQRAYRDKRSGLVRFYPSRQMLQTENGTWHSATSVEEEWRGHTRLPDAEAAGLWAKRPWAVAETSGDYEPEGTALLVGDRYTNIKWGGKSFETVQSIDTLRGRVWYNSPFDGSKDYRTLSQFTEPGTNWRILKRKPTAPAACDFAMYTVWGVIHGDNVNGLTIYDSVGKSIAYRGTYVERWRLLRGTDRYSYEHKLPEEAAAAALLSARKEGVI